MPRSKRNKQVELAKTKKRGLEWKKRLFEEVRSCVDKYENVFIFSVNDMRNNKMKTVREQWKHSRFFIGKNKIMAMALGRIAEEEFRPNLHKLGRQIKGQRGLLFSNKPVEEVLSWFRSYSEGDYARSGNTATEEVHLPAGPLTMFPHNLEPYLRELGLPTTLVKGVIHLVKDHEVCKAGDNLTPETAKILKLLGYQMAEFHVAIDCVWSKDGTFLELTERIGATNKEDTKQKIKLSLSSEEIRNHNATENEQMDIEGNDDESFDGDEENGLTNEADNKTALDCSMQETSENVDDSIKEISKKTDDNFNVVEIPEETEDKCNMEERSGENNVQDEKTTAKKGRSNVSAKTPRITKKEKISKRESLPKTPDANTSQDSPVFRELRTRSVKFTRKKK